MGSSHPLTAASPRAWIGPWTGTAGTRKERHAAQTRRFRFALLASVCWHLVAGSFIAAPAAFYPARPKPPPLQVLRLREPAPAVHVTRADAPPRTLPPAESPDRRPQPEVRNAPAPAREVFILTMPAHTGAPAEPSLTPRPPAPADRDSPATLIPPVMAAVPDAPPALRSAAPPLAALSRPAADEGALLEAYMRALTDRIGGQRVYPRLAQVRGWEGTVTLRLRLAPNGALKEAGLASSSGREVLDEQALAMVNGLRAWPVPPDALRKGDEFSVLVPVVFRLEH